MINYEELYECLRKEKNAETLQQLPKDFVNQFSEYMNASRKAISNNGDFFSENIMKEKKQYENSMTIFKELMLRRKKKILDLVFVAAETGVMKKDFADMLEFEQDLFQKLIIAMDDIDKKMSENLKNGSANNEKELMIKEDVEEFVTMTGETIGPYKKGQTITLSGKVADVLVQTEKAMLTE